MTLKEKIQADFKNFFKEGQKETFGVLRMILAAVSNAEIEKRGKGGDETLTDDEVLSVLRKEQKKRKEAADLFRQGGRAELAEKEEAEAKIISSYLPAMISKEELEKIAEEEIAKSDGKNMGAIIKAIMERAGGRADGKTVSEIVKSKIS